MNREQRRHPQQQSEPPPNLNLQIRHGHNGHQVVVQFSQKIDNLLLTDKQADDMIAAIMKAKAELHMHRAAAAREGGEANA